MKKRASRPTLRLTRPKIEAHRQKKEYQKRLVSCSQPSREPVDAFFDKVMVMVDDERIRANRLALLQTLTEGIFHHCRFLRNRDRRQRIQRIFETVKELIYGDQNSPRNQRNHVTRNPPSKYVYFFGGGKADGNGKMKDDLGGKGAGLAEMTNAGLPVPPGFTIQTEACREYMRTQRRLRRKSTARWKRRLRQLEELQGQKLGQGRESAAGQRALGREVFHARHDGHHSQPRPE